MLKKNRKKRKASGNKGKLEVIHEETFEESINDIDNPATQATQPVQIKASMKKKPVKPIVNEAPKKELPQLSDDLNIF